VKKLLSLLRWLNKQKKLFFFTGAGISTSANIPDYRGPKGVWTSKAKGVAAPTGTAFGEAIPTTTHMAIKTLLEEVPQVEFVISQNVDGLHRRSGVPREKIAELHGNTFKEVCWSCNADYLKRKEVKGRLKAAKTCRDCLSKVPHFCHCTGNNCPNCGSMLKDSIIHFKEDLTPEAIQNGFTNSETADLHIVLGSSLRVTPACQMPRETVKKGGKLVIINLQKTPLDPLANVRGLRIFAKTDEVMEILMDKLNVPIHDYVDLLQEEENNNSTINTSSKKKIARPTEDENMMETEERENLLIAASEINHDNIVADRSTGHYVEPLNNCPHVKEHLIIERFPGSEVIDAPCSLCSDEGENMICGCCYTVLCGRHRNGHMIQHHETCGHSIVIGIQDLSFWCYQCDGYLNHKQIPEVAAIYNELHKAKFNEEAAGLEELIEQVHMPVTYPQNVSGLWVGEAVPHPSLADQWIATNPIKWALSIIPTDNFPNVFGAGFFNDAADIPDQPVIFYTLKGMINPRSGKVLLSKIYEASLYTEGYEVKYDGQLIQKEGIWIMKGTWVNEKGESHGSFGCALQK